MDTRYWKYKHEIPYGIKIPMRTLYKVLYVPDLRKNFFSVRQVANKSYTTTYTKHECYFTSNGEHGRQVLTRKRVSKLYKLQVKVKISKSHANTVMDGRGNKQAQLVKDEAKKYMNL